MGVCLHVCLVRQIYKASPSFTMPVSFTSTSSFVHSMAASAARAKSGSADELGRGSRDATHAHTFAAATRLLCGSASCRRSRGVRKEAKDAARGAKVSSRTKRARERTDCGSEDEVLLLHDKANTEISEVWPEWKATPEEAARATHLVHLGDALRGPRTPSQHNHPLALRPVLAGTGMLVDELDHLVCEVFPPAVRVRAGLVRRDGERRVEKQDAGACP